MPNLAFWDQNFLIAPYFMLALGIYTAIVAMYGFGITTSANRGLLIFLAILIGGALIAQLASMFLFMQIHALIKAEDYGTKATDELKNYGQEGFESITKSWDYMQQHLHCCGAYGANVGYTIYKNTIIGKEDDSVPDSCCRTEAEKCGKGVLVMADEVVRELVYVDGCLVILMHWMRKEVLPMIGIYLWTGGAIALVELIILVLVSVHVSQINRKKLDEESVQN